MVNVANEWADAACNSVVWLKNIRDGISTPEEALKEMEANIARIRAASNLHCTVPPEGYECSRTPGHEGPCAAHPVAAEDQSPTQEQDYPVLDKARFESDILRIVKAPHYFYRTQTNEYAHLETQKLWTLWCHLTRILKIRNDAYKALLDPVASAKEEMRKRGIEFSQFKTMFPKLLSAFDAARQEMEKIPALEADLRYAKSVCAYEKRHREALEVDLAKVNQRLTSANIGLTLAQATAASLPQAISNSDTKRDPELRDALNDHGKAQVEFGIWYSKRYGNQDLTDTWKHAQYQDAREVWMACANLLSDGYQKRARNWRDSFDSMHRRAMTAESRVNELEAAIGNVNQKFIDATVIIENLRATSNDEVTKQKINELEIQLSGERGQVEIWKQRAKEWCEKFHDVERDLAKQKTGMDLLRAKLNYVAGITSMGEDREEFLRWWCLDIPEHYQKHWMQALSEGLDNGKANKDATSAWEGYQLGLNRARSLQVIQDDKAQDPQKIFQVFLPESSATDVHKWFDVSEESYQQHKLVGRIHRIVYRASPQQKAALTNDKATELVKAYGRAVLQRNGSLVVSTMQDLLAYLVGTPLTDDAKECLEDVISHHDDFVKACEFAKLGESGEDGVSYWTHQVNVLNRMKEQAESVLDNVGDESHHSHLNGGSL